jgi:hypothetical protein
VVVVVVVVVDVVVLVVVVVDVDVVLVLVVGASVVVVVLDVVVATEVVVDGADTAVADSWRADSGAKASATTATPATPIIQRRRATGHHSRRRIGRMGSTAAWLESAA